MAVILPFSLKLYLFRRWLYIALILFSGTLIGLTAERLNYTLHLQPDDPLNHGQPFFDNVVAELFATSVFTFFWSFHMLHVISREVERGGIFVKVIFELFFLGCLWVLYIAGAGVATNFWGDLSFCWQFEACRLLTALVAFVWITWITISVIWISSIVFAATRGRDALLRHSHGRWAFPNKEISTA